jgi:hypothetical protein
MKWEFILSLCLIIGIVDQISNGVALIEIEKDGAIEYIGVDLDSAPCVPTEGQKVEISNEMIIRCIPKSR